MLVSSPLAPPSAPPAYRTPSLQSATASLGASVGWGAAGAAVAPFVLLVPPLWLIPAYCGVRSAKSLGRSAYDAGCSALPLFAATPVVIQACMRRALRRATVLHAAGRCEQAARLLAPQLLQSNAVAAQSRATDLVALTERARQVYQHAIRTHLASLPQTRAHRQQLTQALCRADDEAFARLFAALTPAQQVLVRCASTEDDLGLSLFDLAVTYDCPQALAALRSTAPSDDAMFEPWSRWQRARLDDTFSLARRALDDQLPRLAQAMVLLGELSAQNYFETFARYADGDHPVVRAGALALMRAGKATPQACLRGYPDRLLMQQLVQDAQVSVAEVASLRQGNLRAALFNFLGTTELGAQRLCEARVLTRQEAIGLVQTGLLQPSFVVRHCSIDADTARAWHDAGRLSDDAYMPFTVGTYRTDRPLDAMHIAFAERFFAPSTDPVATATRLQAMWESMRSIQMKAAMRRSFLLRLTAVALSGPPPVAREGAPADTASDACLVCLEPLSESREAIRATHCQHPAAICTDCVANQARVNHAITCVVSNCNATLLPDTLLHARVRPNDIDALCTRLVLTRLARVPDWRACWTPNCIGGTQVPRGTEQAYCCPLCTRTSVLTSRVHDQEKDAEYARRLIDHLGNIPSMNHAIRECYWCGTGTEHGDACAHMFCAKCKLNWDFNRGPLNGQHAGTQHLLAQAYVPHAGLLADAGLYEGLEPGSHNHTAESVAQHVRERARAMGLI